MHDEPLLLSSAGAGSEQQHKHDEPQQQQGPRTTARSWLILAVMLFTITACNIVLNAIPSVAKHMAEVTFKVQIGVVNQLANLTLLVPIVAHLPASFTVDCLGIRRR